MRQRLPRPAPLENLALRAELWSERIRTGDYTPSAEEQQALTTVVGYTAGARSHLLHRRPSLEAHVDALGTAFLLRGRHSSPAAGTVSERKAAMNDALAADFAVRAFLVYPGLASALDDSRAVARTWASGASERRNILRVVANDLRSLAALSREVRDAQPVHRMFASAAPAPSGRRVHTQAGPPHR